MTNPQILSKEYISLLTQAQESTSRKEALSLIHRADAIRQQMYQTPEDRYSRWCGGAIGGGSATAGV